MVWSAIYSIGSVYLSICKNMFHRFEPFDAAVEVEAIPSQETHESDSEPFGVFHCETARCRYGAEDRHTGHKTFLQQFITGASAHHQHLVMKWKLVVQQSPAN